MRNKIHLLAAIAMLTTGNVKEFEFMTYYETGDSENKQFHKQYFHSSVEAEPMAQKLSKENNCYVSVQRHGIKISMYFNGEKVEV